MAARTESHWRALARLIRPDARRYGWLVVVVTLGALLPLVAPLVTGRIIDRASKGAPTSELVELALIVIVLAIVANVVSVVEVAVATTTAWRTTNELRVKLLDHVLALDQAFHRRHPPGQLIERIDGDVTTIADMLSRFVVKFASSALMTIGMVVVLAWIDWRAALVFVGIVGALVIEVVRRRNTAVGESADERGAMATLFGGIEERLTAGEDLRSNGALDHAMHRFATESAAVLAASVHRSRTSIKLWRSLGVGIGVTTVALLLLSAVAVRSGSMTSGESFTLFAYAMQLTRPLYGIVDRLEIVQKAGGAMTRVIELTKLTSAIDDRGLVIPPDGPLAATFRDVSLAYEDGETVLRSIDLEIAAGRSVGLVGRTGSGKTSLARLVLRLVDATDGEVHLGGVPIRDIPIAHLRRRVALIPQEVQLLAGTIRDNVTLFDPTPDDAAVRTALRNAGLHALAADLQRRLGPGGSGLSAGEAQLVALARVWLRDPDIVVLDEPTARVDPATEARLHEATTALLHGRTAIVIAHRLSTVDHLDEIVVVDDGRIVERGPTAALLADRSSWFAGLVARAGAAVG
jgi:ATP-binding cassette, subfamily B, bacterial